jgi:LL-diaminopimelate aminotransferase
MPGGSYFVYVKARGGRLQLQERRRVSQFFITEQSLSCVPWDDAGAYLRFSARIRQTRKKKMPYGGDG